MPTESFAIEEANGYLRWVFTLAKPGHLLNEVKTQLVNAGWSEGDEQKGSYRMDMPYGMPVTTVPDPQPVKVVITDRAAIFTFEEFDEDDDTIVVDRVRICWYDPYREDPTPGADIVWLAMELTISDAVDALAGAIAANTYFSVPEDGVYMKAPTHPGEQWWVILLEAEDGGTYSAPVDLGGLTRLRPGSGGFWNSLPYTGGAGWQLSDTYGGTTLKLTLLLDPEYPRALFRFQTSEEMEGECRLWHSVATPASIVYTLVASRYQFFLWTGDNQLDNVMAAIPYIWEDRGIYRAAVMAFGLGWRNALVWQSGWSRLAINSAFQYLLTPAPAHRLGGLCCSWNTGPFLYADGDELIENPFVMGPRADLSTAEGSRVVGKLWNSFIMRRDAATGEIVAHGDGTYYCVARNSGTGKPVASLWVRIG